MNDMEFFYWTEAVSEYFLLNVAKGWFGLFLGSEPIPSRTPTYSVPDLSVIPASSRLDESESEDSEDVILENEVSAAISSSQ